MKEVWKDVPNYAGFYQVSNFGRVKAIKRKVVDKSKISGHRNLNERILKQGYSNKYRSVSLCRNSTKEEVKVHVLVAMAFLDHRRPGSTAGLIVDHIDGNRLNNNVENLQIITQRENLNKVRIC